MSTDIRGGAIGDSGAEIAQLIAGKTIDVPDFPKAGIIFKDLTPIFSDGDMFRTVIDSIIAHYGADSFDVVVGIEARGFILASAVAYATGHGMALVRKAGKLPRKTLSVSYDLEYGQGVLEMHEDGSIESGARVLIVDDVLATGGTIAATSEIIERAGGQVMGLSVILELGFLNGRKLLEQRPVHALLRV